MEAIKQDVFQVVADVMYRYHDVDSYQHTSRYFASPDNQSVLLTYVADDEPNPKYRTGIIVMAHIIHDMVVIETDNTDRPLYEALMGAGIPREKIILAYAGEKLPIPQGEK
ncbi:MAG TPA: element excision factor XisI family protein [Aggregatilineales bacterium]|nr:element excision factor XisI family protein [Aggregatilineales bacterium]